MKCDAAHDKCFASPVPVWFFSVLHCGIRCFQQRGRCHPLVMVNFWWAMFLFVCFFSYFISFFPKSTIAVLRSRSCWEPTHFWRNRDAGLRGQNIHSHWINHKNLTHISQLSTSTSDSVEQVINMPRANAEACFESAPDLFLHITACFVVTSDWWKPKNVFKDNKDLKPPTAI